MTGQVVEASPDKPYLSFRIVLDANLISEMIMEAGLAARLDVAAVQPVSQLVVVEHALREAEGEPVDGDDEHAESLSQVSRDDLRNLRTTLDDARAVAPEDLRSDVARLYDFTLLTIQAVERADGDLEAGLIDARANTDQERVEQAIVRVSRSIEACGQPPLVNASA